jgi:coenzyme PQQ precursor peptide PqqA
VSYLERRARTGVPDWHHRWENKMAWTTPRIVEVTVGMEVTSYESAE